MKIEGNPHRNTVPLENTVRGAFLLGVREMNANSKYPHSDSRLRPSGLHPVNRFRPFPRDAIEQSIPARFAQQVARAPDGLAVKSGGNEVSYGALDRLANRIANAILAACGQASEPVVLLIEQGVLLVAGILGTLKAGKIYVPLDPSFPPAHLAGQIADAGARIILTTGQSREAAQSLLRELPPGQTQLRLQVLEVDVIAANAATHDPQISIAPDAGAYIFYTSGSTGRPKGVLDSHRNVLHNIMRYTNTLRICADDRLTLLQGPSFSGAVSSLFGALLNGAAVFPFDVPRGGADCIGPWLQGERITIYHSVPALFRRLAEGLSFPALRIVRLEGDQAAPQDIKLFKERCSRGALLVNGLGATECGIARQFFVDHDTCMSIGVVPVGYPVEDMDVVVLDDTGRGVISGEVGEIVVRSRYLAQGYWRQPSLTAAAFGAEPGTDGLRSYHTGDLGRLRSDGCLEHLGRKDFSSTKVGGNRVHVADVEAALLEVPDLKEAAVAILDPHGGEPRLAAYLVPRKPPGPTVSVIRRCLAERLPPYMIPSTYVMLEALPLNANGKVDRLALPPADSSRPHLGTVCNHPEDLLQYQLVRIWEEVLGVTPIGIRDDFFELGGSSLLALEMVHKIEQLFDRKVSLSAMMAGATVERLAEAIKSETETLSEPITGVQVGGSRPPFFFLHGDYLGGGFYCQRLARRLGPDQPFYALHPFGLDDEPIPESYQSMAARHLAALRVIQRSGPYRLGGSCNGGLVALEVARCLLAKGERIDRLILIGASAMNVRWKLSGGPIGWLGSWMRRRSSSSFDRFLSLVLEWESLGLSGQGRFMARKVLKPLGRLLVDDPPPLPCTLPMLAPAISERRKRTRATYRRLDKDYTPAPYPGRVIVLWPDDDIEREQAPRWWRAVAREVDFRVIPGNHATSATVHADAMADELHKCLVDQVGADTWLPGRAS
jgi:amino acid adenylation domain-containing protein